MPDGSRCEDLIARADQLAADRSVTESHWEEVRRFMAPLAGNFASKATPGEKLHREIFDNTAEQASDMLVSALHTNLTGEARWFGVETDDTAVNRDGSCARYLEGASEIMFGLVQSTVGNFAPQMDEDYSDLVDFGTSGIMIRDVPGKGALFTARPLRELYLAENAEGRVDTVFRRYELSARQAVQEWGDKAPAKVKEIADDPKKQDEKAEYLHAIQPRKEGVKGSRNLKAAPIASYHLCISHKEEIEESGYHEMPIAVSRWRKKPGEVYGRGCGMKALADTKMLQRGVRIQIRGAEKIMDPPLLAPDDGVIGRIKTGPNKITTVRADMMTGQMTPVRALNTGARPDLGEPINEAARKRIEAAYYYNLIQVLRDPKMTATQVIELAQQVRQLMGPVIRRQEAEKLQTMIQRLWGICVRTGQFLILGPLPEKMRGRKLRIVYTSPLSKAARSTEVQAILRTLEYAVTLSQYDPEALDRFDVTKCLLRIAEILGFPKDLQRTDEDVAARRAQRAQEKQAAQQLEIGERVAVAGAKVMGGMAALKNDASPATEAAA